MHFKIPAISIVAPASDYGKTRLINGVVSALADLNISVGVIKHAPHNEDPDLEKDTWKYREAGAIASAMLNNEGLATYYVPKSSLEDAIEILSSQGADIILCEGFKDSYLPKLVIVDEPEDFKLLTSLSNVKAAVAKGPVKPPAKVPVIECNAKDVTKFIQESFLCHRDGNG
jgi:molybdopterin-guanine dinucleotide biosynthesis protein B